MEEKEPTTVKQTDDDSSGIVSLAKMLKERENIQPSEPCFGRITSLTPARIQLEGMKVLAEDPHISALFNIYEKDAYGRYIHLNKRVAMLKYNTGYINGMPDFLILGVVVI